MEILFGWKTTAIFDVWSFEHILSGLSIGALVSVVNLRIFKDKLGLAPTQVKTDYFDLVGVLFIAFMWETLEHYLETGLAGQTVAYWFQGVEYWPNRLIADPAMLVLGYYMVTRWPKLVVPARISSMAWLLIHIFVFPHSMYLHEIL